MTRVTRKQLWALFLSVVMVLSVSAAIALIGMPTAANHGGGDSDMIDPNSDYTEPTWDSVWWGYGPNAHETGEQAGWAFRSTANDANGDDFDMEYFQFVAIHAPWGDFSDCAVTDTDVAGIDRDDDNWEGDPYDPSNDDSLVQDIQNSEINEHYGYFQFAGPDDPGGRGINLDSEDSFTAGLSCFHNPEEEGWYRLTVWFNGTNYEGDYEEFVGVNEWKYFCDNAAERCSDRDEAIETLGPPPTTFEYPTGERTQNYEPDTHWSHTSGPPDDGSSDDGAADDDGSSDDGAADDGAADDDGSSDDGAADDGAADDDGSSDDGSSDDGAADDDGSSDDGSSDDGSSDDGSSDDGAADDDGSSDDGAADDDGSSDDGAADDTDDGAGDDGGAAEDGEDTPSGDGPGFGPLVAILALLVSAFVMNRRD